MKSINNLEYRLLDLEADRENIQQIHAEIVKENPPFLEIEEDFNSFLAYRTDSSILGAFLKDKLVGFGTFAPHGNRFEFGTSYVSKNYRNNGIHKQLIQKRLEIISPAEAYAIVYSLNTPSTTSLSKSGFEERYHSFEQGYRIFVKMN